MAKANGRSESEERDQGLECPRCGCRHLPVLYTRYRPKKIVRVRKCRHCGRRVITHEAIGASRIPGVDDCANQQRGLAGVFDGADSGN
jgi:hypothetical protein